LPESFNDLSLPKFIRSNLNYKFFSTPQNIGPSSKKSALVVYKLNSLSSNNDSEENVYSTIIEFQESQPAMFWFFLMAFLGGIILNLMPCVFPIVSIKAFSVLKTSGQALQNIRKQNLAYSAGVIFCFIVLGLLLSILRSSGTYLGWGFQLQNPYVVLSLAFIFFILALSFFDIWSWNFIPKFATQFYAEDSLSTSFLTGLLAVIVASPCTAPFMGAAIGFAITQSILAIIIVFLGLGLGMSLPFLLMALFPQVSKFLPKPGAWMVTFKKIMGVMLIATVIWLLWVFMQLIQPSTAKDLETWNGLNVDEWSSVSEDLKSARFVNFTADWCVTCKVNERLVFSQDSVQKFVNENQIKMYKVDWTKREDKIAQKLAEFGRIGVPLYLYFPKGSRSPEVLSELLTPQGFISNLKDQDSNTDSE
jgi:thiol:disulfide interchange protein DsbD